MMSKEKILELRSRKESYDAKRRCRMGAHIRDDGYINLLVNNADLLLDTAEEAMEILEENMNLRAQLAAKSE